MLSYSQALQWPRETGMPRPDWTRGELRECVASWIKINDGGNAWDNEEIQ